MSTQPMTVERDETTVGGSPAISLRVPSPAPAGTAAFTSAQVLPGRGMMVLRIRALVPGLGEIDILDAPPPDVAAELLADTDKDEWGNLSFSTGGAILLPFANRIRGRLSSDGSEIETTVAGEHVVLPANGGGKLPGAERCAIHGLILAREFADIRRDITADRDIVSGRLDAGDFDGHWLSMSEVTIRHEIAAESYSLSVTARNVGTEPLPVGIGWHPYFTLPSGQRQQAVLQIPASKRAEVNNYDDVLPTGRLLEVADTAYDYRPAAGRALGDQFLDDCFVDLAKRPDGDTVCEILDPEAHYGLRIVSPSPEISGIQVYAPPEKAFVVVEPQFNWADPYGREWPPGTDTGMVVLSPGRQVEYRVRLELVLP